MSLSSPRLMTLAYLPEGERLQKTTARLRVPWVLPSEARWDHSERREEPR